MPDRYGNGTNVLALPTDAGFQFSYGPGSFARHRAEADGSAAPCGSSTDPTWPGTWTNRAMWCRFRGAPASARDGWPPCGRGAVSSRPERAAGGRSAAVGDPATVDQAVPASALAIGAHPDDIEFGCGATLAKWAAAGCRIHHLILTDGSKGSWDPDADVGRWWRAARPSAGRRRR